MRRNHVLSITHQGFGKPEASTFEIEPYCLKVVKRRWYVVARSPYYSDRNKEKGIKPVDVYRVYALDRISDIQDTGRTFKMKKNFDVNRYFEGCLFEYHLKPTFDFYQLVLAQGDQVEVLEPESVRNEMRNFAKNMLDYYTWKEDKPCKE